MAAGRLHGHRNDAARSSLYVYLSTTQKMTWHHFIYFAIAAALLWIVGAVEAWRNKKAWAVAATTAGLVVFFAFILLSYYIYYI